MLNNTQMILSLKHTFNLKSQFSLEDIYNSVFFPLCSDVTAEK